MPKTNNFWRRVSRFCAQKADQAKLGMVGTYYCIKKWRYALIFAVSFFIFDFLLTFFADGSGNLDLLLSGLAFGAKMAVIGRVLLGLLTNFTSLSGVFLTIMSFLQGLSVMLMIYVWRHREKSIAIDGASTGSIASVIGFVALGCPSCGISLLSPILAAIAGASAGILAERIGIIFIILAFALLIFTVLRLGYTVFILVSAKRYKEKHAKSN